MRNRSAQLVASSLPQPPMSHRCWARRTPRREVAREARRSRLRLQSAGVRSDLTLPPEEIPSAVISPSPNSDAVVSLPTAKSAKPARPQLVEAYATRTRESGEMTLFLAWQEGANPETVRGYLIALNFYSTGVTASTSPSR